MNAYETLQNEGEGGYVAYDRRYPKQPTLAEQDAILAATRAELEAKFAAEWTRDVTIARRAEWNVIAKTGVNPQKQLGYGIIDLKRAIAAHAL